MTGEVQGRTQRVGCAGHRLGRGERLEVQVSKQQSLRHD